jgi:polyisoprenoid-binding protein YceI
MRINFLVSLAIGAALVPAAFAEKYTIDSAHAAAEFAVKHMMVSTVRGNLGKVSGTVDYDPANPGATRIEATVDVKGLSTRNDQRDTHLKSADFFDADKFPTLTFVSKSVAPGASGHLKVTGDLTIKGVTKSVVLDVEGPSAPLKDQKGGSRIGVNVTTKINRMDYGVNWNRVASNGVVVSEEVGINLDLELVSAPTGGKQGN